MHGLLLLSTDRSSGWCEKPFGDSAPRPFQHGCISLPVSYLSLGRWAQALGGRPLLNRAPSGGLSAGAFLFGFQPEPEAPGRAPRRRLRETEREIREALEEVGPQTLSVLQASLGQQLPEMTLAGVPASLTLACWETRVAWRALPRLRELASAGLEPEEGEALRVAAERIWAAYLHLGEAADLAFDLGSLLASGNLHRPALRFFQRSLEVHGAHTATFYNLALCHFRLGDRDQALSACHRALELDGGNDAARDLSRLLGRPLHRDPAASAGAPAWRPRGIALPSAGYSSNLEHLQAELLLLDRRLQAELARYRRIHSPATSAEEAPASRIFGLGVEPLLAHFAAPLGASRPAETPSERGGHSSRNGPREALHAGHETAALAAGVPLRLPELARRLGLDFFERSVVFLALAPELDPCLERSFAELGPDPRCRWPTIDLALRLFAGNLREQWDRRRAFDAGAPLSAHRLLRLSAETEPLPALHGAAGFRLEPRIVAFLLDREPEDGLGSDADLAKALRRLPMSSPPPPAVGPPSLRGEIAQIRAFLAARPEPAPILTLDGPDAQLLRDTALCLADPGNGEAARGLLVLRAEAVAAAADPEDLVARALREVELTGAPLLVEEATALCGEGRPALALHRLLTSECSRVRILAAPEPWLPPDSCGTLPLLSLHVPAPNQPGREELWHRALGPLAEGLDLGALAGRFRLRSAQIASAAHRVRTLLHGLNGDPGVVAASGGPGLTAQGLEGELYAACRAQCLVSLEGLAQRIESVNHWDDLIVPAQVKAKLRGIENWLRYRHVVHTDWGFAQRVGGGRGMAVMFAGSSGTGKTMAAGILGRTLNLDLYRIDLSSVVSKYIGETEKNLARIFSAAKAANAILFFDEADALFGKRSEVKDSHDRYANVEVSYLLQRMESYDGIAILATNLRSNLDAAFTRRLQMIVEFPFPSVADREQMWRRLFPPQVPQAPDVDLAALANRFALAGGNIKNCALDAALSAAAERRDVEMRHLLRP